MTKFISRSFSFAILLILAGCDDGSVTSDELPLSVQRLLPPSGRVALLFEMYDSVGCHASELWLMSNGWLQSGFEVRFLDECIDDIASVKFEELLNIFSNADVTETGIFINRNEMWSIEISNQPVWSVHSGALTDGKGGFWDWESPPMLAFDEWSEDSRQCNLVHFDEHDRMDKKKECIGKFICFLAIECFAQSEHGFEGRARFYFAKEFGFIGKQFELMNSDSDLLNKSKFKLVSVVGKK